jgi:hypothetical protein
VKKVIIPKKNLFIINNIMPAKSKKQLNFFKLVKAYVDSGPEGVMNMWGKLFPKRKPPTAEQLEKIVNTSKSIKPADLEDMVSGVDGDEVFGNNKDFKVGYWMKFDSWYSTYQGQKKRGTFIAKIKRVRPDINLLNFNSEDIYSESGAKIAPVRRPRISSPDFIWLDFAYFDQIKETAKEKKDLTMKNEIRKLVREVLSEAEMQDTGGIKIKKINSDEEVTVKTGMLVQSSTDETSKGKVKNVGVNFDVIPHTNNLNIYWYHGDKAGTTQKVDLDDVVAM